MTDANVDSVVAEARGHTLGDLLRRTARRFPSKRALVDGARSWTYEEFDLLASRFANAVAARGIGKGDRVAVHSHNRWEYAVLAFGLARLGAVMVPINFMLGAGEVAFILRHAEVAGLIVEDELHPVAVAAAEESGVDLRLRASITAEDIAPPPGWDRIGDWSEWPEYAAPEVSIADDDLMRLMYTSGTESRPKGAMLSSRNLIWQYVTCLVDAEMDEDDVDLHALPFYHCAQLDCFLGPDVYVGATSVVVPRPDPDLLLETMERERVSKFFAPPTVWISLLRHPRFDATDLSSLRKGYYGASPMPVEILREIQERLPQLRLWNLYGQTEMSPVATVLKPGDQIERAGSAGRPALNVETKLVGDDGGEVPPGEVGEIVHRSPQATLGYFRDEEKTAEAYRDGWFHSGDLGVMDDDGYLAVVDRKKDMIKSGGENVASREVEEAIYALDGVAEVAVIGLPDPRWVEAVTAAVVPRAGREDITEEAVAIHCRALLAGFKVPKRVVVLEELPKNPSGKILKRELRDRLGG